MQNHDLLQCSKRWSDYVRHVEQINRIRYYHLPPARPRPSDPLGIVMAAILLACAIALWWAKAGN